MKLYFILNKFKSERVNNVKFQIDKFNLKSKYDIKIFEAILGFNMNIQKLGRFTAGMIGCYISHVQLWKNAIMNGDKIIAIAEDDVYIIDDKLEKLVSHAPENWDFILAGYHEHVKIKPLNEILGTTKKYTGIHFYLVNVENLKAKIDLFDKMTEQIDIQMSNLTQQRKINTYLSNINCANQSGFETDVQFSNGGSKFKKDFQIIGICGICRSGTTWQRNAIKTILELNGLRVAVGNTGNEYQDKITDFIGVDCDVLIFKTHKYSGYERNNMDVIFTSNRDLNEVQKSWQRIADREITMSEVTKANKDYIKWSINSDIDLSFNEIQENKINALEKIINVLNLKLKNFENIIDIDVLIDKIEAIKPPATGFGKESGLFFNHIAT